MAKRKSPEQSLFDNLEPADASTGRDAAIRSTLLGGGGNGPAGTSNVALHEAAQSRYLNYALSVITSRALPDVRDGLKPVQRRILTRCGRRTSPPTAKHRKCATVSAT
jgi:DNA gyrase subunit A